MSMYRQLWLSILVSMLFALSASLFASLINARAYLEAQLSTKNRDNAASLALAISQGMPGPDDVILAVTAQFDSGQYEHILVVDPQGKKLVERVAPEDDPGAPQWFIRLLPIEPAPGQARITSGWRQVGTISLMSHVHFAYQALWETALYMTGAIALAGLLGGILSSLVLRRLRRPLQAVVEQARSISDRLFVTIPEPAVPELRQLASAMNDTVQRIRGLFEDEAQRYEQLRREANFDPLTGLANRGFFMNKLEQALESEDAAGGTLAILRVAGLDLINRQQGREVGDELICRVGLTLEGFAESCHEATASRLGGSEFALLLPPDTDAAQLLTELMGALTQAKESVGGGGAAAWIGYGHFQGGGLLAALLARVDAALIEAHSAGINAIREAASEAETGAPSNAEQWRTAIRQALEERHGLRLAYFPIRDLAGGRTFSESPLRIRLDASGEWLPAGRFIPVAERLGLIQELDLATLSLALEDLDRRPELEGLWIHVSARSIAEDTFLDRLQELLFEHPEACARLWLEIQETRALHRLESLRSLVQMLKPLGCHLGLEHFGHQFDRIGEIYDLGLDFLKVDASFIRDVDSNAGNQAFLVGLCDIAHKIGIRVFAEGVETQAEMKKLLEIGFDGVTGPVLREAGTPTV